MKAGDHFMRKLVLVIGHSHLAALSRAHAEYPKICTGLEVVFLPLAGPAPAYGPAQPFLAAGKLHRTVLALLTARRLACVVTAFGGNTHNEIALARHPQPFDTVLPEAAHLPMMAQATTLPFALIRRVLQRRSAESAALLGALRAATPLPILQVESPPPIPSEPYLRANAGGFAEMFATEGVAPAALRYKLWRAHSGMIADLCAELGVTFLAVPPDMQDSDGMLVAKAWPNDPTHANAVYGGAVLQQIADHLRGLAIPELGALNG